LHTQRDLHLPTANQLGVLPDPLEKWPNENHQNDHHQCQICNDQSHSEDVSCCARDLPGGRGGACRSAIDEEEKLNHESDEDRCDGNGFKPIVDIQSEGLKPELNKECQREGNQDEGREEDGIGR